MAELLYTEKLLGRDRKFWREDGNIHVTTSSDVSKLVDDNKRRYADAPEKYGSGAFHEVARVDANTIENLARQNGLTFGELLNVSSPEAAAAWSRFLNDRDTRAFRTRPGKVVMKAK